MEVARRVALLVGCLAAAWFFLWLTPDLVRVEATDFAAMQARRRPWSGDRELSLSAFVEKETRDRTSRRSGEDWLSLLGAARRLRAGESPGEPWGAREGSLGTRHGLWFLPSEAPVSDLGPGDHRFVAVETAEGIGWLTVSRQAGASATSAPSSLRRPHRGLALWILLAGFVAYFLLPRRRADERTLLYARASAGIIPDLLGVFLASAFFALPILIVTTNAPSGYVFDSGWWPIVAIMWTLALGGVVIVGVAAWYRSRRLVLLPDALRVDSIRGSRTVPHAAMTSARVESVKAPRWLRRLMLIGGMLDVRVAGQALMLESRSDPVLVITCDRAAPVRILLTGLDDPDRLLEGLRAAGVAVTDKGEGSKA